MTDMTITSGVSQAKRRPAISAGLGWLIATIGNLLAIVADFNSYRKRKAAAFADWLISDELPPHADDFPGQKYVNYGRCSRSADEPDGRRLVLGDIAGFLEKYWPAEKCPTLYVQIHDDMRRTVVWDGRILHSGTPVTWLSYRHWSKLVIREFYDDAANTAFKVAKGFAGFTAAAIVILSLISDPVLIVPGLLGAVFLYAVGSSVVGILVGKNRSTGLKTLARALALGAGALLALSLLPPKAASMVAVALAQFRGLDYVWPLLVGDRMGSAHMWLDLIASGVTHFAANALIALVVVPIVGIRVYQAVLFKSMEGQGRQFNRNCSARLRLPTRDAFLLWDTRITDREIEYDIYCDAVRHATGYARNFPFLPLGISTGLMRSRSDNLAPMKGQMVGQDGESARQHTIIFGGTGEGKTRLAILPMIDKILRVNWGQDHTIGAYITDGKGNLYLEVERMLRGFRDDYKILGQGEGQAGVNLAKGLKPLEIKSIYTTIYSQVVGKSGESFWVSISGNLLMNVASILLIMQLYRPERERWIKRHNAVPYSLVSMALVAGSDPNVKWDPNLPAETQHDPMGDVIEVVHDLGKLRYKSDLNREHFDNEEDVHTLWAHIPQAVEAAMWLKKEWGKLADQTRSSAVATLNACVGALKEAPRLADRFCRGLDENEVDVTYALDGHILMIAVSENDGGAAGKLVANWLKTRFMIATFKKLETNPAACEKQSCLLVADEAQDLLTTGDGITDLTFFNKCRQAGVLGLYATQHVSAFQMKIGDKETDNLINNFRSRIIFKTEDQSTLDAVVKMAGNWHGGSTGNEGFWETQAQREYSDKSSAPDVYPGIPYPPEASKVLSKIFEGGASRTDEMVHMDDPSPVNWERIEEFRRAQMSAPAEKVGYSDVINMRNQAIDRADDKRREMIFRSGQDKPRIDGRTLMHGRGRAFINIQRAGMTVSDIVETGIIGIDTTPEEDAILAREKTARDGRFKTAA